MTCTRRSLSLARAVWDSTGSDRETTRWSPSPDPGSRLGMLTARSELIFRLAEEAKKGSLAKDGKSLGGIEEIACGGMHTLAIDEAGNVSPQFCFRQVPGLIKRFDHGVLMTARRSVVSLPRSPTPTSLAKTSPLMSLKRIPSSLNRSRRRALGLLGLLPVIRSRWLWATRASCDAGAASGCVLAPFIH